MDVASCDLIGTEDSKGGGRGGENRVGFYNGSLSGALASITRTRQIMPNSSVGTT